jgi:hypothetical protein
MDKPTLSDCANAVAGAESTLLTAEGTRRAMVARKSRPA